MRDPATASFTPGRSGLQTIIEAISDLIFRGGLLAGQRDLGHRVLLDIFGLVRPS